MVDVVDTIVAQLIVKDVDKYEANFARMERAHAGAIKSLAQLKTNTFDLAAEGQKYKAAAGNMAQGAEQADQRIARSRKARVAVAKASDEAEVASAKTAARAKTEAEVSEAARSARLRAAVEKGVASSTIKPGSGATLGRTVAREADGGRAFMGSTSVPAIAAATAEVAAEREVNHLLADKFDLQQRYNVAQGGVKRQLGDQLEYLRRIETYERAGLSVTEASVRAERELTAIERLRVRGAAQQMRAGSGGLASGLRTAAVGLAGAFSASAISHLNDEYIKLQNQLRIAGLEGTALERVQKRLFDSANKGGVDVGQLARLYARLSSLQNDLGVSQEQSLTITGAVANAIKIQGTSAESASGAILGLNQAFSQGKVQASEFNQIVEGLRPLLLAAAQGSEKYKGSLGALRLEVLAGHVTSRELFDLIEHGAKILEGKAAKAALTTAQGFTVLKNALTVYFGEADKANGVSAALGSALTAIANNLDTLIPAVAAITVALGVKYVAGAVAATLATESLGASLLLALGNPVVLAIAAVAGGLTYLALTSDGTAHATAEYAQQQSVLNAIQDKTRAATDRLATATGKARTEALANAQAVRQETIQYLENARAALIAARAKAQQAKQNVVESLSKTDPRTSAGFAQAWAGAGGSMGGVPIALPNAGVVQATKADEIAQANLRAATANVTGAQKELARIEALIKSPPAVVTSAPHASSGGGTTSGAAPAAAQGRSAAETEQQFNAEVRRLKTEELQDLLAITTDADKRLRLQQQLTDLEYQERIEAVKNEKDYTAAQKAALTAEIDKRFGRNSNPDEIVVGNSPIDRAQAKEREDRLADLRQRALQDQQDTLRAEADLVDDRRERARIERRILGLAQEEERARLETSIAAGDIEDATTARANLARRQSADRTKVGRDSESPFDAYRRRLDRTPGQVSDAVESYVVDELNEVHDAIKGALQKAIGVKDPLLSGLLDLLIDQVVMKPLAEALNKARASGGGGFGGLISGIASLFGGGGGGGDGIASLAHEIGHRAAGGNVVAGVPYEIGERGRETVVFGASGRVFPNGALPSIGRGGGGTTVIAPQHFDLSGVVMTEALVRQLDSRNRAYADAVAARAGRAAVAAAPGRMQRLQDLGS